MVFIATQRSLEEILDFCNNFIKSSINQYIVSDLEEKIVNTLHRIIEPFTIVAVEVFFGLISFILSQLLFIEEYLHHM